MVIANEEIKELIAVIPEGHQHLRTTLVLQDGREITLQEATVANLVRAYITEKRIQRVTVCACADSGFLHGKKGMRNGSFWKPGRKQRLPMQQRTGRRYAILIIIF